MGLAVVGLALMIGWLVIGWLLWRQDDQHTRLQDEIDRLSNRGGR